MILLWRRVPALTGLVLTIAHVAAGSANLLAQEKALPPATASRIQMRSYHFAEAGKDMQYGLFVPFGLRQDAEVAARRGTARPGK